MEKRNVGPFNLASLAPALAGCVLLLALACGGGGSHDQRPDPPALPPGLPPAVATLPEGAWKGTVTTSGGPLAVAGLVLGSGETRLITSGGFQWSANLLNGTGLGTTIIPVGDPALPPNLIESSFAVTRVVPKTSFTLVAQTSDGPISLNMDTYLASYDAPVSNALLAGTYQSAAKTNSLGLTLTLTVQTNGTVAISDATGRNLGSGALTIPDAAKSGLQVAVEVKDGSNRTLTLKGLALYLPNSAGAQLVFAASGPTNAFSGTFTQQVP